MIKKLMVTGLTLIALSSTQVGTTNAAVVESPIPETNTDQVQPAASVPFVPNACITVSKVIQSPNNTRDYWIVELINGQQKRLDQSNQVGGWFKTVKAGVEIEVMIDSGTGSISGWRIL